MMLYLLECEVAGGLGEDTIIDAQKNILYLDYEFAGYMGDEILETIASFVVTFNLAKDIENNNLSGYQFQKIGISTNEGFYDFNQEEEIKDFGLRLMPIGTVKVNKDNTYQTWTGEDFCLSDTKCLVVTERALNVLKKHKMNYCEITELKET